MLRLLLFAVLLLMGLSSCQKDEPIDDPNLLHYDGENATGPLLQAGIHELAVRFTPFETEKFKGRNLEKVRFFMGQKPDKVELIIYGPGSSTKPGAELYAVDMTNSIQTPAWNEHTLSQVIPITGEDLWISILVSHAVTQQSLGCDAGPNIQNGDWLYQAVDQQWRSYRQRTNESVNWNIRGVVAE